MHNVRFGEICELFYLRSAGPCLPHLVRQLSDRLRATGFKSIRLTWDCDDIAMFEIPGHRIMLATTDAPNAGEESRLLISVGPVPDEPTISGTRLAHSTLCRRIARGIQRKHPADKVQNRSWPGVLTPERVDDLLYPVVQSPAKTHSLREFVSPRASVVMAEEKKLRDALGSGQGAGNIWRQRRVMAAGLLINGMTWSMATAAPALVLAVFGSNLISTVLWTSTTQLPR